MKSSTSCRICGHWIEGDYNAAPVGIEGYEQRMRAEREMRQGFCSKHVCVDLALPRGYVLDATAIAEDVVKAGFRNVNDYTTVDAHVSWSISSFHDMDYIWAAHLVLACRPDTDHAVNNFLDDLFLLDQPGKMTDEEGVVWASGREIQHLWLREPVDFFDYRGERRRKRSHQFINWMHTTLERSR